VRHHHVGPVDVACAGCLDEARQIDAEIRRQRFWRIMLLLFLMILAIGAMAALSWYLREHGWHLG
jgi:heme/copper-type cytochrome/quinol oxidase subunit 2